VEETEYFHLQVIVMHVGGKVDPAAGLESPVKDFQGVHLEEPAAAVFGLRPGIREIDVEGVQAPVRQPRQERFGFAIEDEDIRELFQFDFFFDFAAALGFRFNAKEAALSQAGAVFGQKVAVA
jgi:hypothetical protein